MIVFGQLTENDEISMVGQDGGNEVTSVDS